MKKGHVPIRQCVGCRERREKTRQLRFVRSADGRWLADHRQRLPGRGAYVCSPACLQQVKKNKRYRAIATTADIPAAAWGDRASLDRP